MKKNSFAKRAFALLLGSTMLATTACGNTDQSATDGNSAAENGNVSKEYTWTAEHLELDLGTDANVNSTRALGDNLYFGFNNYDDETGATGGSIKVYSLSEGKVTGELAVPAPMETGNTEDENVYRGIALYSFEPLSDGNFAAVYNCYESSETDYKNWYVLETFDGEGNLLKSIDLREYLSDSDYLNNFLVDGEGRMYIVMDTKVHLFDADGTYQGEAAIEGCDWAYASCVGKDGKAYVAYYPTGNYDAMTFAEIDFEGKRLGATFTSTMYMNSILTAGVDKNFLFDDGTSVYEFDTETQTSEKLFSWLDCDINGTYVNYYKTLEDGRILVFTNDWESNEKEAAILTKHKASEVTTKEEIVLGAVYGASSDIQKAAVNFNRNNEKYRITVKEYYDSNSDMTYDDAISNFNNELISGNGPDLVLLDGLDAENLTAKGILEDLTPYLEASTVLNRTDMFENVLEAYTYDGKLVAIPSSFTVYTVVGKASEVGSKMGWSLSDMMSYVDQHPGVEIFYGGSQMGILQYCMAFMRDQFLDTANATCSFDSDAFKEVLEFVAKFPEEYDYSASDASEGAMIEDGTLLLSMANIYNFDEIQMYNYMFQNDACYIGYPTTDGSVGCGLVSSDAIAINAASAKKDAAFSFLESYIESTITNYSSSDYTYGFVNSRVGLEAMAEKATAVEYVMDDEGNYMLDANGETIVSDTSSSVTYGDGWSYDYHKTTQEEVDQVMELINVATPIAFNVSDDVISIIQEEAAAYFKGQKSVDEVASIIQSRVQIYLSEKQ